MRAEVLAAELSAGAFRRELTARVLIVHITPHDMCPKDPVISTVRLPACAPNIASSKGISEWSTTLTPVLAY